MQKFKPDNVYDHSVILLRHKVSESELTLDDVLEREIIFNNNDNNIYIRKHNEDSLVSFASLDDTKVSLDNSWSQVKSKNEILKYSLIF